MDMGKVARHADGVQHMSGTQKKTRKRKKPSKPYPSFPLTAHNNGQWCKNIRGRIHFFGVWNDPQAALDNYLEVATNLHGGRQLHT